MQNEGFATSNASSSNSRAPSQRHTPTGTGKESFFQTFFDSDSEDDLPDVSDVDEKITQELFHYSKVKFTSQQKQETHLLEWCKACKTLYPCLTEAVKALLHTPATSVPSERIFSASGYIARARRSKILPKNLNKFIFIKKNMKYMPDLKKEHLAQVQEMADNANREVSTD